MKVEIIFTPPKKNKINKTTKHVHVQNVIQIQLFYVIPMPDADCYVKSNNQEL